MDALLRDIRFNVRRLIKTPAFTSIILVTLMLGIGANTAIFSVVHAVLIQPLPYGDPDRLVAVFQDYRERGGLEREWFTPPSYLEYREQSQSLAGLAAWMGWSPTLTGEGEPEQLAGARLSHNYFDVLQATPAAGRWFRPEDEAGAGRDVVVIGHGLWQRRFGGASDIIGRSIALNGTTHEIIGVTAPDFRMPFGRFATGDAEIYRTIPQSFTEQCGWGCITIRTIGRLAHGVPIEQARTELQGLAARIATEYPATHEKVGATVVPLREQLVGGLRPALTALLAAAGFVLLIACVNVANLLLARATEREREVAIRTALGAERGRIVRQLLTESILLSLSGGALAILLAVWGVDALVALGPPQLTALRDITVSGPVLGFAFVLSLVVGVAFGLLPALQSARPDLTTALKEGGRGGSAGAGARRLRSSLVVAEVAIALMLLAGAGLFMRSFMELQAVPTGFDARGVLVSQLSLAGPTYDSASARRVFFDALLERVGSAPQVESVGAISSMPLAGSVSDIAFFIEGRPEPSAGNQPASSFAMVAGDYFRAMRISLREGRPFGPEDRAGTPAVALVSRAFAERYFPGESVLGRRIRTDPDDPWWTIIGVVDDVRHEGLEVDPTPQLYLSYGQFTARNMSLVARSRGDAESLTPLVRAEVARLNPNLPLAAVRTLEGMIGRDVALPRLYMALFSIFAAVAVVLAAVGIYGVIAYSVVQRTREIGIRLALGAAERDVLMMVVRQGGMLALLGVGLGLIATFGASRLLRDLLFGISATDPLTFAAVAVVLTATALLASYLPARRAARADPLSALRAD